MNTNVNLLAALIALAATFTTDAATAGAKTAMDDFNRKWPGDSALQDFVSQAHANEAKGGPGPYDSKLHPYAVMRVNEAVLNRAAEQDTVKDLTFEMHVTRIKAHTASATSR